jgi:hypothetical protein
VLDYQLSAWSQDQHNRPKYSMETQYVISTTGEFKALSEEIPVGTNPQIAKRKDIVEKELIEFVQRTCSGHSRYPQPTIFLTGSSLHFDKSVL